MKKLVMLKPDVNGNAMRNAHGERPTLGHFVRHIEGKALRVTWELKETAGVRDEEDEEWEVRRTDIVPMPKFQTVGEELTGRSAHA